MIETATTSSASWPLWRCVVRTASIWPVVVEIRAPMESAALQRILQWNPDARCLSIERRPTVRG